VKIRNELFDRSVNEAMNKAVRRLETRHDLKIIRNFAAGDSSKWEGEAPPPPPPIPDFEDIDVTIKKDSINGKITMTTTKSQKLKTGRHSIKVQSVIGKSHRHIKTTKDTLATLSNSFMGSGFPGNMGKKIEQLEKLSKQISIEYKGWETGRHIDEKQLKILLNSTLTHLSF
jgi:two-component system phosphate regulon sensor histidine kinase PhoR